MDVKPAIREEFDKLMTNAENWPTHYNLGSLAGFLIEHPEIVDRPLAARIVTDREYRKRTRIR